jgi:uncharacterized Fe-S cluster protein YjdI
VRETGGAAIVPTERLLLQNREAEAMAVQLSWDSKACIHSGNCVKALPQVFKIENGKFVIDPTAADDGKVRAAVAACPSGALKITN